MAIQITQDPIGNFLNNLPRYALELRRQDQQANDNDRRLKLAEEAAEMRKTEYQQRLDNKTFFSDLYKESYDLQRMQRKANNDFEAVKQKLATQQDDYNELEKEAEGQGFIGSIYMNNFVGNTFEKYLEKQSKPGFFGGEPAVNPALYEEFKTSRDNAIDAINTRPSEIDIPDNVILDESYLGYINSYNQNLKTEQERLNQLTKQFGGEAYQFDNDLFLQSEVR
tara:strand:+ start:2224 stop:2895 length:672 start_codon:yes stop_codon:yes gene_type:complete